ncbi:MAG: hypothetical protein IPJ32_02755 [Sphingobacteriaceae bacterium]|nr:hypothetical protein [Sphingobacteriaceae bacterium]
MENENFKPEESLQLINVMINKAKNKLVDDGFLFIFWGWLVFLAATSFYLLVKMEFEQAYYVWYSMPAGGIFTMIYAMRQSKKENVKSFVDEYLMYIGIAFGVSLTIILVMGWKLQMNCYPMVILLYALTTFIYGGILKFMPLVIFGALSFPISVGAFFVDFHTQILLLALSVFVSYLIPGYMLQYKFKQQTKHV